MPERPPNVLFLMSDQHAYRYLGHRDEGGEPVETPTFDDLAANGTTFEGAYCAAPMCTPSRLSLLTGREPRDAGGWGNASLLKPGLATLPGTLSDAGYETCLLGKMHLGGSRQFAGFDHRPYGDLTGLGGHQMEQPGVDRPVIDPEKFVRDAGITGFPESVLQEQTIVQEALSFLREQRHANPDQPWFLCASFSRPHWPRTAPARHFERYWPDGVTRPAVEAGAAAFDHPLVDAQRAKVEGVTDEETMRSRAGYFACVSYLDEVVGDLLTALRADGLLENTVVVYTSDHGELAGEHGLWGKLTWHEASARVPLVVQTPAHRDGSRDVGRVRTPVSLVDMFPTLCGLAGVDAPGDLDGVDLSDTVRTGAEPDRPPVTVDSFVRIEEGLEYRAVRDGRYKYVGFRDAPELLFDLERDPRELTNLAPDATGEDAEALERLREAAKLDFEALDEERERHRELEEQYRLVIPRGTENQYLWPDGRVVDADTQLYRPDVLADDASLAFDDYPEDAED